MLKIGRSQPREHDRIYLTANYKQKPKEYFKFIAKQSLPFLKTKRRPVVLDIGCATGEFLHYLSSKYPNADFNGIDVMKCLLDRAKHNLPSCRFFRVDIMKGSRLPTVRADVIYMNGVHSIFDDFTAVYRNVAKLLAPGGKIFIFGIFNPENVDVILRVRSAHNSFEAPWQPGWNLFSKKSVGHFLKGEAARFKFTDWEVPIDIAKNVSDPLRTWTFKYADGRRGVVNGIQLLHPFALLEISPRRRRR